MKVHTEGMGSREREVLAAMITDSTVLSRVIPGWEVGGSFATKAANTVGQWCVDYCRKHNEAPGKLIRSLFRDWAEDGRKDETTKETIDFFLGGLPLDDKERLPNPQYFIDTAGNHFDEVKLRKAAETTLAHINAGNLEKAKATWAKHATIKLSDSSGIDLFNDVAEMHSTFAEEPASIVKYNIPSIDRFFASHLEQGGFISFMAPNKVGKSFWLMDFAWRTAALLGNRRKVAFFLVGDMSRKQFNRRFYARSAVHPFHNPTNAWPYELEVPKSIRMFDRGEPLLKAEVKKRVMTFDHRLDPEAAKKGCDRVLATAIKSKQTYFMFASYPGRGISTVGIRATLQQWETQEGFRPDVICVDYADNLAPVDTKADKRDQINDTWLDLSAIRLERNCLLMTATQCDTKGFAKGWLTRENFSEDRRKLDHVSGFVGLNVSPYDKSVGVTRLNWVNLRDGEFGETDGCWVAGCLPLANPAILAHFPKGGDKVEEGSGGGDDDHEEEVFSRNGRKQRGRV